MSRGMNIAIATYIKAQKTKGSASRPKNRAAALRAAALFWVLGEISKRSCVIGQISSIINNG